MPKSLRRTLIAAALVSLAALLPATTASAQTGSICPATFHVLHDDRIGNLELQAGNYQVTVRGGLSCAASSQWFARFLQDWDGVLPRPWRLNVNAQSFSRGNSGVGFSVVRVANPNGGGGGGRHPGYGALCPGTFRVLHNDRIGALRLPRGQYTITRLSAVGGPSCARASRLFTNFLDNDYSGILPGRWALDPQTGTFRRGAGSFGFRVKPAGD
jgi:hypothetical protein